MRSTFGWPSVRRLLVVGAHADDIEIGCGGTILTLLAANPAITVRWIVMSGSPARAAEARACAAAFLQGAADATVAVHQFRDGYFPAEFAEIKDAFEDMKRDYEPDLILTHLRTDRHQDHRVVSDLTWNSFRAHPILEYEIPKYDGDWGVPNVYVPLHRETLERKVDLLMTHFASQNTRSWFTAETFEAVARLRGIEAAAATGLAEAFTGRKVVVG